MKQHIAHVALIVHDYDEAIDFFTRKLRFTVIEDTPIPEQNKRWVLIAPPNSDGVQLLLAKAANEQQAAVGNQAARRVFLFLMTDNFDRDYNAMCSSGVHFERGPKTEAYGTVAVFKDLYGNLWDLIEPANAVA